MKPVLDEDSSVVFFIGTSVYQSNQTIVLAISCIMHEFLTGAVSKQNEESQALQMQCMGNQGVGV